VEGHETESYFVFSSGDLSSAFSGSGGQLMYDTLLF